jgi:hypothetical protein
MPQLKPSCSHVAGQQSHPPPQTLGANMSQVCPLGHVPQSIKPPQPSLASPQS